MFYEVIYPTVHRLQAKTLLTSPSTYLDCEVPLILRQAALIHSFALFLDFYHGNKPHIRKLFCITVRCKSGRLTGLDVHRSHLIWCGDISGIRIFLAYRRSTFAPNRGEKNFGGVGIIIRKSA